jgi:adhesin/invasin
VLDVRDAFNNHVNSSASVTMDFGTNAGPGTLSGALTQGAVNGVATFSDLAINTIANGYTLKASATGLTDAISNAFNITPPAPSASLSQVVAGTPSFTAGGNSNITVTVRDGLNNLMSGVTVTLSSNVGSDVVTQPAAVTDGSGQATGNVAATAAGTHSITAVAGGITLTQKPDLAVSAGAADAGQSTLTALPASITQTTGTANITVTVRDQYGNPVNLSNVVLSATGTGNTLLGGGSTNASGVATGTLSSSVAEVKTVSATADGTPITQTANVTVTPPSSGITHTLLTSGSNATNLSSYTTASIAPAPNALITVAVRNHRTPAANSPSLSGGGMTSWTQVTSVDYDPVTGSLGRLTVFRAMSPSPGSGPITITFVGSVSNVDWIVSQWTGVDQSGSNGSGAIGQIGSANGDAVTTLSVPLAPFANPNNVAYGAVGARLNAPAVTPGAGFTEIAEVTPNEATLLEAQWATNLFTIQATSTSAKNAALLGIEIKAGP